MKTIQRTARRLAAGALLAVMSAQALAADEIFFVDIFNPDPSYGSIRKVGTDGKSPETILDTGGGLRAIDVDWAAGKIYWCDSDIPVIRRCNIDGTGQEDLVTTGLQFPSAIAIDPAGGKMYWGDQLSNELWRANLDGSGQQLLRNTAFHRGIALDTVNGKVYWSTSNTLFKGEILRCNLDGTGLENVITSNDPEFKPSVIALDIPNGKIYWSDYVIDMIRRANLDNTNVQSLYVVPGNLNPRGVVLDHANGKVYWGQDVDFKSPIGAIMRMDLDGAAPETVVSGLGLVNYLALSPPKPISCPADITGDGSVNVNDLLAVINAWGACPPPPAVCGADIHPVGGDGAVNVNDLLAVINAWGPCQ